MGKELRAYRLAENVMKRTNNKYPYPLVLEKSKEMVEKTPFRLSDISSHHGDDYSASVIARHLLKTQVKMELYHHMPRASHVKPLSNFHILVYFLNPSEKRIFDCHLLFNEHVYERIKDEEFFKNVHVDEMGFVCWDDETDIHPWYLYENSTRPFRALKPSVPDKDNNPSSKKAKSVDSEDLYLKCHLRNERDILKEIQRVLPDGSSEANRLINTRLKTIDECLAFAPLSSKEIYEDLKESKDCYEKGMYTDFDDALDEVSPKYNL